MLSVTFATTALGGLQPAVAIEGNLETVQFVEPDRQEFGANDDEDVAMAYMPIDPTVSPRILENTGGLTEQQVAQLQQEAQSWPETPSYPVTAEDVVKRQGTAKTERSGRSPGTWGKTPISARWIGCSVQPMQPPGVVVSPHTILKYVAPFLIDTSRSVAQHHHFYGRLSQCDSIRMGGAIDWL
ncbi:hypothetical protein [Corynebacterium sp. TAE3-ERU16]|uniref:hypothetical protein n=1 Tax=Corynebacterium sp. TAE3-ERU16 TaxID=2849493 RepID=UPI001C445C03|nr:hypothetical protein [Corynebacterium sp. TAE3-ERU16]MBV7293452.1 hypothetical protein [Corynebacterium sp. TAE3-ERU16]